MSRIAKLGLLLVVTGVMTMYGPVFGFTTIAADRTTDISTADSDALVGIEVTGEVPDKDTDAVVVEITNNANEAYDPLEAQATIVEDSGGSLAISSGFDSSLPPGETTGVELTCDGNNGGEATVVVDADAYGSTLEVRDVSHSMTFQYSCAGGTKGDFETSNPTTLGDDFDELEFDLKNIGQKKAQIKYISIETTAADAAEIENVEIDGTEASNVALGDISELRKKVQMNSGEKVTVGVYGFQDTIGTPVSIEGKDVSLSLYGSNGKFIEQVTVTAPAYPASGEDVVTNGDVVVEDGAGDIDAGGDVTANDGSKIDGSINADGEIDLGAKSEVSQSITAGDEITVGSERQIKGDIISETGSVTMEPESVAKGRITAGDSVTINDQAKVDEYIDADGDVTIRDGAAVDGNEDLGDGVVLRAGGDVTIESGAKVGGEIEADGTIVDNR
ncbi:hypothetical protein C488_05192 [Natrinema pellirubrum DSM 15624]|uniref:Uncharacterized protein n=1 Tax=Natrinema pellirubrum (strain DSM 15624 / CIP 106293 / JCM 10476 / NCIMB 786 / 157) TaxID=797303 RepID=L0JI71_NATP1|nr:hypothetical protein [Natrinema pellirubrum]AGB30257.1 Protein of unknown function, DUF583 [Natrinema pellirubrum DSM 15624]ELY78853.1 hypothetical protein C488_05192 [Natrinema pellirubrum DSM 15624]